MVFPSDSEDTIWDVTPDDYIAQLGDTKEIYIMWGHPYEHILFDMSTIPEITVTKPDSTVEQLTVEEISVDGMDEEGHMGTFVAYKTSFTVDQMGDSVISVKYEDVDEDMVDFTKAVIHSGEEMWVGWDAEVDQDTEIIPYMRPYGMEEGFVFAGKALNNGASLTGADVEVEIYHTLEDGIKIVEAAEEKFPYDAPMVFTRLTKTNDNGDFLYTLDEPGIWFVGATMEPEEGQPVRGVFIVPVIESFPEKSVASGANEQASDENDASSGQTTASAPGFVASIAFAGILGALYTIMRKE
ncbi:nickel transporter [Methanolobus halotolerans]|uniref:Nickel transporter n=2 Tax=Methanolobus halotolerans TaxID=2052935 RepID=A0A4E0PUS7_9EURY|nr:nickel transporter [Methanolobus halotolerans]